MKNIAKMVLIVFVSMLEVGYTDDCTKELFEEYKAHSAEYIRLKNKCKPLLEKIYKLANTYKNTVEYKEYEAIKLQQSDYYIKWRKSAEAKKAYKRAELCNDSPEDKALKKRYEELESIANKTQTYKATEQAKKALDIEKNTSCQLFLDGVYDIDKAFEKITKAKYKAQKSIKMFLNTPQYKAYTRAVVDWALYCSKITNTAEEKYLAEYNKTLEATKKALEPLETAFRNSTEVKEYEAECRGITFSADENAKEFSFFLYDWNWTDLEEERIISYIYNR